MGYDGLDRLTAAISPSQWGNATYAYDPLDNIRSAEQGTRQYRYTYNATSNRLTDIKTPGGAIVFTIGYDAQGNITNKSAQNYTFDRANRMSQINGLQTYRYDGMGRRVQTTDTVDGKTTFWIYSQAGQVLHTSEARRNQNLSYIYLGNSQVATRAVAWTDGAVAVKYQHTDALGSPVAETNTAGVVVARHSYAPFGEAFAGASDGTGYTGHVMDQGTGLTYMQQRYYDPQIGRFLSADPVASNIRSGLNFNRYNYAANNPYMYTDPDGRQPCSNECMKMRDASDDFSGMSDTTFGPGGNAIADKATRAEPVGATESGGVEAPQNGDPWHGNLKTDCTNGSGGTTCETTGKVNVDGYRNEQYAKGLETMNGTYQDVYEGVNFTRVINIQFAAVESGGNLHIQQNALLAERGANGRAYFNSNTIFVRRGNLLFSTMIHEFFHAVGVTHRFNRTNSIMSYSENRSIRPDDVRLFQWASEL